MRFTPKGSFQSCQPRLFLHHIDLKPKQLCLLVRAGNILIRYYARLAGLFCPNFKYVFHWRSRHQMTMKPLSALDTPVDLHTEEAQADEALENTSWYIKIVYDTIWQVLKMLSLGLLRVGKGDKGAKWDGWGQKTKVGWESTLNAVLNILTDDRYSMQFFVIVQIKWGSGRVLPGVEPPTRWTTKVLNWRFLVKTGACPQGSMRLCGSPPACTNYSPINFTDRGSTFIQAPAWRIKEQLPHASFHWSSRHAWICSLRQAVLESSLGYEGK